MILFLRVSYRVPGPLWTFSCISQRSRVVPKSEAGRNRVFHDLSFPKQHSVNDLIPPENSNIQYESIDNVTTLLNHFGTDTLMAKTDIKDAFRMISIHPDEHKCVGFSWHGSYYDDRCLPIAMGASSSCKIFEFLSQSLQWVMYSKFYVGVCPTC